MFSFSFKNTVVSKKIALFLFLVNSLLFAGKNIPVISFNMKSVNFDTLIQGEVRKAEFKIKNIGTSKLVISHTRSSCGCTTVSNTKKNLYPNAEGTIKVVFDSRQFRGPKIKRVYVYSNDPVRPVDTLTIYVYVKPELDCTPRNVVFLNVKRNKKPLTKIVKFYNAAQKDITLLSLLPRDSYVKTDFNKAQTLKAGDTIFVVVTVFPPIETDDVNFYSSIAVKVNRKQPFPFVSRVYGRFVE